MGSTDVTKTLLSVQGAEQQDFEGLLWAKEFDNPGPLYTEPKTHAEEGEIAKDEQRKPK